MADMSQPDEFTRRGGQSATPINREHATNVGVEKDCRWPDSNRHGPFTAQRILSPLRLPFRHIGVARHEFKRFMRPAKMNFAVADAQIAQIEVAGMMTSVSCVIASGDISFVIAVWRAKTADCLSIMHHHD